MNSTIKKCLLFLLVVLSSVKSSVVDEFRDVLLNSNLSLSFEALEAQNLLEKKNFDSLELSRKCAKDLTFYRTGIQDRVAWAMKMLDASSKVQAGILVGNVMELGNYDECVGISYADIQGKHCTYTLLVAENNVPLLLTPTSSFCLPASCDIKDLELLVNSTIAMNPNFQKFGISPGFAICSSTEPLKWSWAGIISVSLLAIFSLFIVSCTILDIFCSPQMKEKGFLNIANQFSMCTSGRMILDTKAPSNTLSALQGMRSLSMIWIYMAHQIIAGILTPSVNNVEIAEWIISWKSMYLFAAPFGVDTFFTISGFLTSYLFLKEITEKKNINIFIYYIYRYIRLTPSLIVILILVIYLFPRFESGPGWDFTMNLTSDSCYQNWWAILLYIQNTVDKGNACLIHTWYLAVDMQLFWIAPIILYPLARKPQMGMKILGLFFLLSIVAPILVFISGDYVAIIYDIGMSYDNVITQFAGFYSVTYTRAGPWIVGIYVGYEMATKEPRKFSKIEIGFFWFLTIMAFGICIYGDYIIRQTAHSRNMIFEMIFVGLSKPLWGVGIAWIIYACSNGYGGIVNSILSMRIFLLLSRVSYNFYLVHIAVLVIRVGTTRTSSHFSLFNILSFAVLDMVVSLVIAFIFSVLIEGPTLTLGKMVFRNEKEKSKSGKQLRNDNSKKETTENIKKEM